MKLVPSSMMPKLGKAGSLQSRQAIVHSLVHIESWAIDLSWVLYLIFEFGFCFPFHHFFISMALVDFVAHNCVQLLDLWGSCFDSF